MAVVLPPFPCDVAGTPLVTVLLAELQASEERRQYTVRFHQLMNQRCHREIPIQ